MKFRKHIIKVYALDLAKVYKINKRKSPSIPIFERKDKSLPDTDIDNDLSQALEAWRTSIWSDHLQILFTLTSSLSSGSFLSPSTSHKFIYTFKNISNSYPRCPLFIYYLGKEKLLSLMII